MKTTEFFEWLKDNSFWKKKLKKYADEANDGMFFFTLGEIFGKLNIKGWESERFTDNVLKIVDSEGW
jgi:hypothetical protein